MHHLRSTEEPVFRLTFEGKMTYEVATELEDRILNAMHRYPHFEVDLSGVHEIDLCGVHLLGLLQSVGGKEVVIVATSPTVEQASRRLLGSFRGASLARAARQESAARGV
jgi:anti-anti-sigma regulatory factor